VLQMAAVQLGRCAGHPPMNAEISQLRDLE